MSQEKIEKGGEPKILFYHFLILSMALHISKYKFVLSGILFLDDLFPSPAYTLLTNIFLCVIVNLLI